MGDDRISVVQDAENEIVSFDSKSVEQQVKSELQQDETNKNNQSSNKLLIDVKSKDH